MKLNELREKNVDQLKESLSDAKKEAFNLRFQKVGGQLENTARIRVVRRSVARIATVINEKIAAEAEQG
jgi:large subunit ribosomal protein L29|tara:strand:+ start:246 stop:452 length:207 start_codon:yes stop_codon:yes gene_type:complete